MSMLKKIILIVISVSLVSLTTLPFKGYCDDWVYVGSTDLSTEYYNSSSVEIDKQNKVIKMRVKRVFTDMGKNDYLKKLEIINNQKYREFSYVLILYLLDYKEWKYSILNVTDYSKSGSVLFNGKLSSNKLNDIIPDSIDDLCFKQVLRDYNIKR